MINILRSFACGLIAGFIGWRAFHLHEQHWLVMACMLVTAVAFFLIGCLSQESFEKLIGR